MKFKSAESKALQIIKEAFTELDSRQIARILKFLRAKYLKPILVIRKRKP